MTELPRALAPWATQLDMLPAELALGLYPLLARLDHAFGPARSERQSASGDPDGYAGLVRRGPYERLLASEWLLADELPDEFLRRAVAAEHLFLARAMRQRAASRQMTLLFDAGPSQLGGPRIVQLAILIVFARRASAADARLRWGILQAPGAGFLDQVSSQTITRLLDARTAAPPTGAQSQAWLQAAGPLLDNDDAWVIGGTKTGTPLARWPHVSLADTWSTTQREVSVELSHPARTLRRLVLDLPDPKTCAQLIRDPFVVARPKPQTIAHDFDASRPLSFSSDGRRVFAWLADGRAISYPVPNSAHAGVGKPRIFKAPHGEELLAYGSSGKRMFAITHRASDLFIYGPDPRGGGQMRLTLRVGDPSSSATDRAPARSWTAGTLVLADGHWHLHSGNVVYRVHPAQSVLQPLATTVLSSVAAPSSGLLLARLAIREVNGDQRLDICIEYNGQNGQRQLRWFPRSQMAIPECSFFGWARGAIRAVAVQTDFTEFRVFLWPSSAPVQLLLESGTAHGAVEYGGDVCLLVLEQDGKSVSLLGRKTSRVLMRMETPIAQLCASGSTPHVAWLTSTGKLVVYSLTHSAPVLRLYDRSS